jgi:hypothetical protein
MARRTYLAGIAFLCVAAVHAEEKTWSATFEDAKTDTWAMTDPAAWKFLGRDSADAKSKGLALALTGKSKYVPKHRSPFNYARFTPADVTDFTLDVSVKSTARDYGHRDLCVIFGWQNPDRFYYAHLARDADPHAHSVFLVKDAPRVSIAAERTKGVKWTDGWHRIRIVRKVEPGTIDVFFDDMDKPVIKAVNTEFKHGQVGLGSFDDTGMFDDLKLVGTVHRP